MPAAESATEHDGAPSAARDSRYPLDRIRRARYVLYAKMTAAVPKPTAAVTARLNSIVHMSRSS
jgi:hypothetical protein